MRAGIAPISLPSFQALVQESRHESGFSMPPHSHNCLSLLVPVAGEGSCAAAAAGFHLRENDILLLPAGVKHHVSDEPRAPLVLFVLYLGGSMAQQCATLLEASSRSAPRHMTISRQGTVEVRRLLRQALHEQSHDLPGKEFLIPATIAELLVVMRRSRQAQPSAAEHSSAKRIREAGGYIASRVYEPWSLPQAAHLAGMSVRSFSDGFRRQFDASFVQFLSRKRVEKAQTLLRESDAQIATVCFESGFEDLSHFYRVFRQITGHPPGEERRHKA